MGKADGISKKEYVKQRTLELYDMLPDDEAGRKARTDIRDEIIQLNYSFFGYVATHTYINNPSITYEDKLQTAICEFLTCWWWYKWAQKYRTDLSFTVFFKPRLGEMIERKLNEVKYSVRRTLCMEAGEQLGKHWAKVRYEDLSKVDLPADKMNALKAMFGTVYWADLETQAMFMEAPSRRDSEFDDPTDKYDTLEELLIHEMVVAESKLDDKMLLEMADMYCLDYWVLKEKLPVAEKMLYDKLHSNLDVMME